MKYLTILILISFLTGSFLYGQDLQNLDSKFGIKKFKLETDFSLYTSKLQFFTKDKDGTVYYKYIGDDMNQFFDVPVETIGLVFYKNKLYLISILFKPSNDMNEKIIYSKLKDLFGNPAMGTGKDKLALDYEWGYVWSTKKTFLQHSKYSSTSDYKPNQLEIFMYSQKLHQQIANDNF